MRIACPPPRGLFISPVRYSRWRGRPLHPLKENWLSISKVAFPPDRLQKASILQLGCTNRLYLPKRYHRLQFFGMQIVGRISADPPPQVGLARLAHHISRNPGRRGWRVIRRSSTADYGAKWRA